LVRREAVVTGIAEEEARELLRDAYVSSGVSPQQFFGPLDAGETLSDVMARSARALASGESVLIDASDRLRMNEDATSLKQLLLRLHRSSSRARDEARPP
jgi:hypothetical protein